MRTIQQIWQVLSRRFARPATPVAAGSPVSSVTARDDTATLLAEVAGLQSGLRELRQQDDQQLEALRQRISQLEAERDIARQDVEGLRHVLEDTIARQETSEIHANTLEIRLREQTEQYQADRREALIRERRQARRLNLAMMLAIAAFVLGGVLGVAVFRMVENNTRLLATVNQGFRDIQASIDRYQADMRTGLAGVSPALAERMARPPETTDGAGTLKTDMETPLNAAQPLPEPDFVASGSLPLAGHSFDSRRDVRSFFEENARQPGVVALPSGLQYRELIPGTGRTPGPADSVVIEYRAFRPDGTELDSSLLEPLPSRFVVSEAPPGLEEALQRMQEGAQWELYVPPALVSDGVRKRGRFGFEPLIYTVELLSVGTGDFASE